MWRILRVREGLEGVSQENGEVWSGLTPLKRGLSRKEQTKGVDGKHGASEEGAVVRKLCGTVRFRVQSWLGQRGQRKPLG